MARDPFSETDTISHEEWTAWVKESVKSSVLRRAAVPRGFADIIEWRMLGGLILDVLLVPYRLAFPRHDCNVARFVNFGHDEELAECDMIGS